MAEILDEYVIRGGLAPEIERKHCTIVARYEAIPHIVIMALTIGSLKMGHLITKVRCQKLTNTK